MVVIRPGHLGVAGRVIGGCKSQRMIAEGEVGRKGGCVPGVEVFMLEKK